MSSTPNFPESGGSAHPASAQPASAQPASAQPDSGYAGTAYTDLAYSAAPQPAASGLGREATPAKRRNTLAIIALLCAVAGIVFSLVKGALILGWILLPVAFVLSIVAIVAGQDKKKGMAITALVLSIVGPIIAGVFFLAVIANEVDQAFGGDTTVAPQDEELTDSEGVNLIDSGNAGTAGTAGNAGTAEVAESDDSVANEAGATRENPLPIGTTLENNDWAVTVNSVNLDGDAIVAAANMFNESAGEGMKFIIVNVTATLKKEAPEGAMPSATVAYVSPDGNTFEPYDNPVVLENQFDNISTMYQGASATGDIAIAVPADRAAEGVLAVSPSIFADTRFVAVTG